MHERGKRITHQKLGVVNSRNVRNWLSTVYRRDELDTSSYFYSYDWRTGSYIPYYSDPKFLHDVTVFIASAAGFGTGIGIILERIFFGG